MSARSTRGRKVMVIRGVTSKNRKKRVSFCEADFLRVNKGGNKARTLMSNCIMISCFFTWHSPGEGIGRWTGPWWEEFAAPEEDAPRQQVCGGQKRRRYEHEDDRHGDDYQCVLYGPDAARWHFGHHAVRVLHRRLGAVFRSIPRISLSQWRAHALVM